MTMRMRSKVLWMACATALACSAGGALAQSRASLADRVAALEARTQQNQTEQSVEQLNRITQLESDVKALRALVEQLQNENQQAGERAKAQYIDLDSRLSRIESAPSQPPAPASGKGPAVKPPAHAPAPVTPKVAPPAAPPAAAVTAPAVTEQAAYDAALGAVRADQYADSAQRFNAFVQQYPESALLPNAYYWMGESYYATQNYQLALDAFKTVATRFPESPKAPGAMLKIGYSLDGLKQRTAAQSALQDVIAKYPDSEEASQAQSRLRAISMEGGG